MDTIIYLYNEAIKLIGRGKALSQLILTGIYDRVIKMKYDIGNDDLKSFDELKHQIDVAISSVK